MSSLILHHFDLSPFAEKVRLIFGLKQLAWASVEIPLVMPKPGLTALTGGYRKTPVLQIGADVYCDTRLIATEIERRFPQRTLFPDGNQGLTLALTAWSDSAFFNPGAGLSMGLNKRGLPEAILNDRKAFFNFMDFDTLEAQIPQLATQLRAHADLVEQQLADGRRFLLGDTPGFADVSAYFPVWMARGNVPIAGTLFAGFKHLAAWESRMQAVGHGTRSELSVEEAHAIARAQAPEPGLGVDSSDPYGLVLGEKVTVAADDYGKDPVLGTLVTLNIREVVIRREDPAAGIVHVHFPRIGYRVDRTS
jgi:glutathione S-transferase